MLEQSLCILCVLKTLVYMYDHGLLAVPVLHKLYFPAGSDTVLQIYCANYGV